MSRAPVLRLHHGEILVDNFAGGGGASLGIEWALRRSPDIAINHDAEAIAMHQANHPLTRHFTENIWKVDPRVVCKARPALAWFSPDCKHFSKAKGGKPVDKNIRGLAWIVLVWAKTVKPRVILLENVEEFEDWGPLGPDNRPDPNRVGLTFRIWCGKLRALGYKIEHREITASYHGTATTRNRLYLIARCDGLPIVWPEPGFEFDLQPRRIAADCIDWSLPTYSIFLTKREARQYGVKRPLAANTMRRVFRGFDKFVVNNPSPYIVGVGGRMGQSPARSVGRPMQTVTAKGDAALAVPYLSAFYGDKGRVDGAGRCHDLGDPLPTQTADPRFGLVAPIITEHANASNQRSWRADEPLRTQCAQVKGGHFALAAAYMVPRYGERAGQAPRSRSVDRPMPTIVPSRNGAQLVQAFLAKHYGGHETPGAQLSMPFDTLTSRDHHALVSSHILKLKGTCAHGQALDEPAPTVQAEGNHLAEVRAFLLKYYGTDQDPRLELPLGAQTSRDRFGLVMVRGTPYQVVDIGMRMLAPHELFAAQGFHDDYIIDPVVDGRRLPKAAQVRCVGNSVCPPVAAALARAQFADQMIEVAA